LGCGETAMGELALADQKDQSNSYRHRLRVD
jgi:hypothetical protein